jgi:REP element-mobilizing transposase RayT
MSRARRIEYPEAIQHVAVNANNREALFRDDDDRRLCLALLASTAIRYGWDVWAYCLMDTHWHALIRTPEPTLSSGMQRMNSLYSRVFNSRHGRSGHSIRHRFMSVPVVDQGHLTELTRYLPLNPVRGGLVSHPDHWHWSSYRAEIGLAARPIWLRTDWATRLHGSLDGLRRYVDAGIELAVVHQPDPGVVLLSPPRREG